MFALLFRKAVLNALGKHLTVYFFVYSFTNIFQDTNMKAYKMVDYSKNTPYTVQIFV